MINQLHFGAIQDFTERTVRKPLGLDGRNVDVVQLVPRSYDRDNGYQEGKVHRLVLPDKSRAYFRSLKESRAHLRDCGAYVLAHDLLSFSVIPRTVLADLPEHGFRGIGSLRDHVDGQDLTQTDVPPVPELDRDSLIELYIYAIVAKDIDTLDKNIILSGNKLFGIDHEMSGCCAKYLKVDFPECLKPLFEMNIRLPEKYLDRLREFTNIRNRPHVFQTLRPYYEPEIIFGMIRRAEYLLENPVLEDPHTLNERLPELFGHTPLKPDERYFLDLHA
jgi:hypothetical protein